MSETNERCYICKWWDFDNQISTKPRKPQEPSWRYIDTSAICNYVYPPKVYIQWRDQGVYTETDDVCSGFRLREERRVCEICNEPTDELFDLDSLDEALEVCQKCLEKETKEK